MPVSVPGHAVHGRSEHLAPAGGDVALVQTRKKFPAAENVEERAKRTTVDGQQAPMLRGVAGFHDQVNNLYWQIFGSAFLISLLGTSTQLSQPQNGSGNNPYPTATR